ncbi:SDR family NAD(P)-dependent oxidoreductase [Sphingobium sp. R-7]|uniref:SDR family NAD(P)-dependent oxidoreductase n=1 Tax=Sphingobium sp. R-7 TaxID=3375449 RepID=UPI00398B6E00
MPVILDRKIAVVTGGGGGIGGATARLLAKCGAAVAVVDIVRERADSVAQDIEAGGGRARAYQVDIADESQIQTMMSSVKHDFGGIDILVNNAALTAPDDIRPDMEVGIAEMSTAIWDRTMNVNVRGTMLCSKHAIPEMVARGGGAIVNLSSIGGLQARPTLAAYGISKAAINMLTQYIATGYGRQGVRCNTVAPGFTVTETGLVGLSDEDRAVRSRHTVLGRFGEPDDVANMIAFLVSDEARVITGQLVAVDAGVTIHLPWYADQLDRGGTN